MAKMDQFTRWQISQANDRLRDLVGKRLIENGTVLEVHRHENWQCEALMYWIQKHGRIWRLVMIDGAVCVLEAEKGA